jgi:hypothetical protein
MASRRLLLIVYTAILVTLVALSVAFLAPRATLITWTNAERIQRGMTLQEVEQLLGGPARDESTRPTVPACIICDGYDSMNAPSGEWKSDEVVVWVYLIDGRVHVCKVMPPAAVEEGLVEMLRRWLRL